MIFIWFVLLVHVDPHPRLVILKLHAVSLEAANKECTICAAHARHIVGIGRVCVKPPLVEGIPQLSLRVARKRFVVDLQLSQITVIVLATALLGGLAITRIGLLAAAAAGLATRGNPLVVVLTALMAERAVLPEARVTVLAPAGRACGKRSRKGLRLRAHNLPVLGGANAALPLDGCCHREIVIIKAIAPSHPLRDDGSAQQVNHLLGDRHVVRFGLRR